MLPKQFCIMSDNTIGYLLSLFVLLGMSLKGCLSEFYLNRKCFVS